MSDTSRWDLTAIKSCLLSGGVDKPVVFQNLIASWPAMSWSPAELTNIFLDQTFKFRLGKKNSDEVQWETHCVYKHATVSNFLQWTDGQCNHDNPLAAYDQDTYWCYADYIHMNALFDTRPNMLKCVDWTALGFDGRDGQQSTFWLGSEDAYTVCHYDTYGCNLVAQIHGRKRWVMFPPTDSRYLYPTRVPYEESSVFSLVDVHKPDFKRHPKFKNVTPYVVTLEPGDVLFLPRHWWHLVESLDTTISINSWIDLEVDAKERLKEAVVRTTMFAMMSQEPHLPLDSWLNPTEDLSSHEECIDLVNNSVDALTLVKQDKECVTAGDDDASTMTCENGKRSIDSEQFTKRKRSRIYYLSRAGDHDIRDPDHHDICDSGHHDICDSGHHDIRDPDHHDIRDPDHHDIRDSGHHDIRDPDHHDIRDPDRHDIRDPDHHDIRDPDRHDIHDPDHHDIRDPDHHDIRDSGHHDIRDPDHHDIRDSGHHDIRDQTQHYHHNIISQQHCQQHAVIVSEEFDQTHVQRLNCCSLNEYLSHSPTTFTHQPRNDNDTVSTLLTQTTGTREQTSYTPPETAHKSTDTQDRFSGDANDTDSCEVNSDKKVGGKRQLVTTAVLVDSITHPDVIALICQKLTDKLDVK